jgi:hypothetical protein
MGIGLDGAFLRRKEISRKLGRTRTPSGRGGIRIGDTVHTGHTGFMVRLCSNIGI